MKQDSERRDGPKRGALLDLPGVAAPGEHRLSGLVFFAVLVYLGAAATLCCFCAAFSVRPLLAPVLLGGLVWVLLTVPGFALRRRGWAPMLAALGLWVLLVWLSYDLLVQGGIRIVNLVIDAYASRLDFTLARLAMPEGAALSDGPRSITLMLLFLEFPLVWLMAWALVSHGSSLVAFCLSGAVLLLPLAFSIVPPHWALGVLFLFWGFLLFAAPALRERNAVLKKDGLVRTPGRAFVRPAALLLLPVIGLFLLGLYRAYPPETYTRPAFAAAVWDRINEVVNVPGLLQEGTGSARDRLDLSRMSGREHTGRLMLRVRHEWADTQEKPPILKDYLRSYVGSVYTGGSWEPLPAQEAEEAARLLGGTRSQTLYAALSGALPVEADPGAAYTLSVDKVNTDMRPVYAPYGLTDQDLSEAEMLWQPDAALRFSGLFAQRGEYSLSAVALPEEPVTLYDRYGTALLADMGLIYVNIPMLDKDTGIIYYGEEEFMYSSDYARVQYSLLPEEQREYLRDFLFRLSESVPAPLRAVQQSWAVPDWALEDFDAGAPDLLRAESDYGAFVLEHYTQLPEETLAFARGVLAEHGLSNYRMLRMDALTEAVRALLAETCVYDLHPDRVEDEDFARGFLTETREGYCVHFATAAVVLLRAAGVPARYAEGYAVPVGSGDWVDVPDYNAHAWAEVYYSGLGWVPVEMTPPGPEAPAAYRNARSRGEGDPAPRVTPSPTPAATLAPREDAQQQLRQPTPAPTAQPILPRAESREERSLRAGLRFAAVLLALALPFALLWLQRLVRLWLRRLRFAQRDRNRAALCVYAHLLRLYEENSAIPYGGFAPPEEAEQLALKARFSNHVLSPEELDSLITQARQLERRLNAKLDRWPRLRCKYLRALF